MTWAHNLLSRRKVYSILTQYSNLTKQWRGERLLKLLLLLTVEGENKKHYIITAYMGRYI